MRSPALPLCGALLSCVTAHAQIQLPPAGLLPGQQYRVLFVTQAVRTAQATDIADYNAFVAADANASPGLAALGTQWRALASTATVSARANTMTDPTPAGPTGVPIYRPDGTRLADDDDDLWDGWLLAAPDKTSLGNTTSAARIWTGGQVNGQIEPGASLGESIPMVGIPSMNSPCWGDAGSNPFNRQYPLYGLSDLLAVPLTTPTVGDLAAGGPAARSLRFVPNATGGHDVIRGSNHAYDPELGALAGVTSDEAVTATGLDLGFAFPFPSANGTAPEQFVRIDPNGRILPDSCGFSGGSYNPTLTQFLHGGYAMVCPMWTDFDVTEPGSDGVYFKTTAGAATFTWHHVAQWQHATTDTPPLTVQCTLFANGEVLVVYEDVEHFDTTTLTGHDCLVGISPAAGPLSPMAVNLSTAQTGATVSGHPIYEYFQPAQFDLFRPTDDAPRLDPVTLASPGTSFVYRVSASRLLLASLHSLPALGTEDVQHTDRRRR